jgi:hypothetical protein
MNNTFLPGNQHFNNLNPQISVNDHGYRTENFNSIDWTNSVVVFGCSMVFGTGLHEEETICYHLSKILNKPVINLGVPASSMLYSLHNQLALKELNAKPYAVINIWTAINRHTYFSNRKPINLGPWANSVELGNHLKMFYSLWSLDNSNITTTATFLKKVADVLWSNTKHLQASFFDDTAELFSVPLLPISDHAADGQHPGPETAVAVAKQLAQWCR